MSKLPNQVAGLVGWYKADALALSDTDPVATWTDSSTAGDNLTQGTAANRPLYRTNRINTLPAVVFDGTNDQLVNAAMASPLNMTVATVARINSGAADARQVFAYWHSAFTGTLYTLKRDPVASGNEELAWWDSTNSWRMSTKVLTYGQFYVIIWRHNNSGTVRFRVDGTAEGSPAVGLVDGGGITFRLGNNNGANFGAIEVAEVALWDNNVSDVDTIELEQYFTEKYFGGVFPGTAEIEVETFAPTVELEINLFPETAEVELETFAPSADIGSTVESPTAEIEIETFAPAVIIPRILQVAQTYFDIPGNFKSLLVAHAYFSIPNVPRVVRLAQAYFSVPSFANTLRIAQAYFGVPGLPSGTGGPSGGIDPITGEEIVADFERIIPLRRCSAFSVPRGKQSWAHYGGGQFRAMVSAGRQWDEEYIPVRNTDPRFWAFMAYVNDLAQNERVFTIDYPDRSIPLGTIAGTALVNGADQVGYELVADGYTGTLLRGDIIGVEGINYTFEVIEDISGPGAIKINPAIRAGGSPADGAEIFYGSDVKYRAKIDEISELPDAGPDSIFIGLSVRFREVP